MATHSSALAWKTPWAEEPGGLQSMGSLQVGHDWATSLSLLNQPWIFIRMIDAEAEPPILWPPDTKSWLTGKDPDAGKDWNWQEEKGVTENEIVGWHHQLYGHESGQTPEDGEGQGSLVCRSPWGHKELASTEWLNNHSIGGLQHHAQSLLLNCL